MYVEAFAYLISTHTPLQGFLPPPIPSFTSLRGGIALWEHSILHKNTMGDPRCGTKLDFLIIRLPCLLLWSLLLELILPIVQLNILLMGTF